ncbi:hypothetical protein [Methylobacterium goesingense]|nr:hypothetical protein [Methylobacterium goesingense]
MRAFPSRNALSAGPLALLISLSTFASSPAQAQYAYEADLFMPPRAVVWRLNERGFTEVTRPRFDGRAYVVEASNPYGERVRLFVDARDGRVLGRQRLEGPPPEMPARVARRAPGYGWTEEDAVPRRPIREAERMVPPADIPFPQVQSRRASPNFGGQPELVPRPDPRPRTTTNRTEPTDRNPMGLNPDARGPEARPKAETPRKIVRLNPAPKPSAPSVTPDAPKLSDVPAVAAQPEAKSGAASAGIAPSQPMTPVTSGTSTTAAAVQPAPDKAAQNWKDVPADAKRSVRVIGGATIVPGTTAKDGEKN